MKSVPFPGDQLQKELDEQYLQILDAISDFVFVKGPQSKIVWANRAFREYYGMSNEQLKDIIDAPFQPPDYTQQYIKDDEYVFTTGQVLEIPREPVARHDGVVRIFNTVKSPIRDSTGKIVMTVGVSRDITDRENQEKLIHEQRVAMERFAKMAALGEMAGEIAHEVSNPLAAINAQVGLLRRLMERDEFSREAVTETVNRIELIVQRVAAILKSILVFSRSGEQDAFIHASLRRIIDDTMVICRDRFRMQRVVLNVESFTDVMLVCRPVQISQVLLNLLNNALDATESAASRWVKVDVATLPEFVEIRVTDSGAGIPPAHRERLFQPLFTTKASGKGTGLGLGVSKSIVEAHHGNLALKEDSAHTCFVVSLPMRQRESPQR